MHCITQLLHSLIIWFKFFLLGKEPEHLQIDQIRISLRNGKLSSFCSKVNYELRTTNYELAIRPIGRIVTLCILFFLTGCETIALQSRTDRASIDAALTKETLGHYYVGRRFYKVDYHMWGWVKEPGQPWKSAKLVMFNEQKTLAPDRAKGQIGSDNNYEYHLYGTFSGGKVYEPASDSFYPEFILNKAVLVDTNPPLIFPDSRWVNPAIRLLQPPEY